MGRRSSDKSVYDQPAGGTPTLLREITADDADIEWKVDLVNRKAALDHSAGPGHPAQARNPQVPAADRSRTTPNRRPRA